MSEPKPLEAFEFKFIDESQADWFTRRLLATIKARDEEIEELRQQLASPRSRSKKQKIEEQLRQSDLTAQLCGGRPEIEYGHHESLPRGEHVSRPRK